MVAASGTEPRVLLDRYELREQVGVGGMGEVWLGWDRRLQREVALKLLLPQLSDEPSFRQRFEVEARAAAALEHPNVVDVYDIDEDAGALFIVMERLPGPSLDRRLAEGPMSEEEVRRVAADLLSGLAAAHAHNLIHRDIKPGNLIRSAGGRWKVGDFGVAKDLASTAALTLVGVAVGTPAYLAPEQLDGRTATAATDLWAAAVVLREALTGLRPFPGSDPIEVAHAIQHVRLPPVATVRADVSPDLAAAIDRGLSLDPRERFATALDMLAAIEGRGPVPAPVLAAAGALAPAPTPQPDDGASRSTARTIGIVAVVAAALVALLLVVVLVAVALADADDDEAPPPPSSTVPAASSAPAPDGSEPEEMFPGGSTAPAPPPKPEKPADDPEPGESPDGTPGSTTPSGGDDGQYPEEEEGAGLGDEAGRDVLRSLRLR